MLNLADPPPPATNIPPSQWQRSYSYMKTVSVIMAASIVSYMKVISLILIALIVIGLLVYPSFFHFPAPDYANISTHINALNAPYRVKTILHFFVDYNVFILLCAFFGAAVGASEILSRYRDEPFLAISSPPGRRYLAVNAGISLAAFYFLAHFRESIFPGLTNDPLMMSIVAGFGAMVVMRSKIFNFKSEAGESYAVGPDAVLSIFLSSVDRQIDRYRASRRQSLVYEETQSVVHPTTAPDFLRAFLVSYQNLTNKERLDIDEAVKKIYNQTDLGSPRLKFMTAAFGFLNLMGENNFKALVQQLKKYQQLAPLVEPPAVNNDNQPPGVIPADGAAAIVPPQPAPVVAEPPPSPATPAAPIEEEGASPPFEPDVSEMPSDENVEPEIPQGIEEAYDTESSSPPESPDTYDSPPLTESADTGADEIMETGEAVEVAGEDASEPTVVEDTNSGGTGDGTDQK